MNKFKIEKFVNYGMNLSKKAVRNMALGQILANVFCVYSDYCTLKTGIFLTLPIFIINILTFFVFKLIKEPKKKHIYLFFGLHAVYVAVTQQIGSYIKAPFNQKNKLILIVVLVLIDVLIAGIMILVSKAMIAAKKDYPPHKKIDPFFLAPFVFAGGHAARRGEGESWISFAAMSFVFMMFTIYFIKYYYSCVLEKIERTGND